MEAMVWFSGFLYIALLGMLFYTIWERKPKRKPLKATDVFDNDVLASLKDLKTFEETYGINPIGSPGPVRHFRSQIDWPKWPFGMERQIQRHKIELRRKRNKDVGRNYSLQKV